MKWIFGVLSKLLHPENGQSHSFSTLWNHDNIDDVEKKAQGEMSDIIIGLTTLTILIALRFVWPFCRRYIFGE